MARPPGGPAPAALGLIALGWLASGSGCSPREQSTDQVDTSPLVLAPCRLEQVSRPALCGQLSVFENRTAATGRKLELFVAVLPAQSRAPEPDPVFLLAGGPGQGASGTFGPLLGAFEELGRQRDIVLLDQRGTGRSAPLRCDPHADDLQRLFAADELSRVATECLPGLDADLSQYTTPVAADDLDEVRAALGYERINLVGMSYGTRLGLVYLRRHPERVRSLVIDGVAPMWMALPLSAARDGQRAFDQLVADCQADHGCAEAYPRLQEDFTELLATLSPAAAEVEVRHPRSGETLTLAVGREAIASGVHSLLYSTELASLLPYTIAQARSGNFAPFVAQATLLAEGQSQHMSLGLLLSVVCTEDVDRIGPLFADANLDDTFLGGEMVADWQRACVGWPRAELPDGYAEPTRSDRPVLVLSGALDPVTPPRWGEAVAQHLTRATHLVVPAVGHGTIGRGCTGELVTGFVKAGSADGLDLGCVGSLRRPPFFVNFSGPEP